MVITSFIYKWSVVAVHKGLDRIYFFRLIFLEFDPLLNIFGIFITYIL